MYLFGTIHLGVPIQDVPSFVMDKFDQSERFDMEIDSDNYDTERRFNKEAELKYAEVSAILNSLHKNNPEAASRLGKILKLDYLKNQKDLPVPQKKLSQRLTPLAWSYTRAYFKQMDLETLEKISPGTVVSFIAAVQPTYIEAPAAWFTRMDPKYSMDLNFQGRARKQGKHIYQLDDVDVLSSSCGDLLASMAIVGSFEKEDAAKFIKNFENMEKAYRGGSEEEVQKFSFKGHPELDVCMLDERNKKWIPRLISDSEGAAMRGQPPLFVAVGTAHLFGPNGLLELLKKEGYSVERVNSP